MLDMKLEKISENQIRCTLTREDLASRHIRLSELAYGSDKARSLFQDMMRQAYAKFGFNADNIPLMIEAIPVTEGSIMLNITKVEDPEELDTRFAKFAPPRTKQDPSKTVEDADDILNLIRKLYEARQKAAMPQDAPASAPHNAPSPKRKHETPSRAQGAAKEDAGSTAPVDFVRMYRFPALDPLIDAASALKGFYSGSNTLYRTSDDLPYCLIIHKSAHTPEEYNKVCNILGEYGTSAVCSAAKESSLNEHEQIVLVGSALEQLAELAE